MIHDFCGIKRLETYDEYYIKHNQSNTERTGPDQAVTSFGPYTNGLFGNKIFADVIEANKRIK
jgi:hypothetical protein